MARIGPRGLCLPLAAHGGAEADEAQRARHGDGNPARPERHIDAIQGDGPPHRNPDQLQKRDQGKDGGGKRAKGSYGHCPSPIAHENVLVPHSQNGEGPAQRPLPLKQGSGFNRVILDVSYNRRFATPRVGITSAFGPKADSVTCIGRLRCWGLSRLRGVAPTALEGPTHDIASVSEPPKSSA